MCSSFTDTSRHPCSYLTVRSPRRSPHSPRPSCSSLSISFFGMRRNEVFRCSAPSVGEREPSACYEPSRIPLSSRHERGM